MGLGDKSGQPIRMEHKDQLMLLIAELKRDQASGEFHRPVPWQALGLLNYPQIIKRPMDL